MADMAVGVVGCGNISATYFEKSKLFKGFEITACADVVHEAAQAAADKHRLRALSLDELLADESIGCVVNLTVPAAHCEVSCRILEAGKHVFSEKPLALSMEEGRRMRRTAQECGKVIGCAPDTWLGGAHQLARQAVDDGAIGKIANGTCHVLSPGMEMWHPNPDFFFKEGGGPVLDLGPYYVANLVNLIGPVKSVAAMSGTARAERTITSEPRAGEKIEVETPTTLHALLEFVSGAKITFSASWDVVAHRHANMELYGTEGTLYVPDPNFFNGEVLIVKEPGGEPEALPEDGHPLSVPNFEEGRLANYRSAGLAEMVDSLAAGREPRCSLDRALHGLEVMTGILGSAEQGRFVAMQTTCERAANFGPEEARALMR